MQLNSLPVNNINPPKARYDIYQVDDRFAENTLEYMCSSVNDGSAGSSAVQTSNPWAHDVSIHFLLFFRIKILISMKGKKL